MSTTINFIERPNLLPQFKCLKYIGTPIESDENYYYSFEIDDFDSLFDSEGVIGFYEYIERVANGENFEYVTPDGVSKLLIHSINEYFVFEVVNNGESLILVSGALQDLVNRISQYKLEQELYYGFAWHMDKLKIYRVVKTLDTSKVPRSHVTLDSVNGLTEWWQTVGEYEGEDSEDDTPDTPSEGEDDTPSEDEEKPILLNVGTLNLTPEFRLATIKDTFGYGESMPTDNLDAYVDLTNATNLVDVFVDVRANGSARFVSSDGNVVLEFYVDDSQIIHIKFKHDDIVDYDNEAFPLDYLDEVIEMGATLCFGIRINEEYRVGESITVVYIPSINTAEINSNGREFNLYDWYKAIPTSSGDTPSDNPTQPDDNPNDDYEFEDYEKPIPSTMKEYFWADNVPKDLLITDGDVSVVDGKLKVENYKVKLTNSEIHQEEFSLIESLTDEETLTFGEASSAVCEFTFSGNVISLKGMRLKVYMYLDRNPENMIRIGEYIVESDTPTADRTKRQVTMYDDLSRVINSDVASWYKGISFPITLRAFASSFFAHFGITIDNNEDLINGEMMLKKATINPEVLSGKDVLTCILQAFGCCGRIGRNGHFQFVYLPQSIKGKYPAIDLYPREDLFPQKPKGEYISKATYIPPCEYESYTVESITQLEIRDSDNAIGTTVGVAGNPYVIEGNFLFYGMTDGTRRLYAQNILGKIEKVMYVPFSVDIKGNPCVEVGDAIRLNTTYDKVDSYVLHRRLHGIQGLRDSISSKGTQYQEQKVNDLSTKLKSTEGKVTTQIETLIDGLAIRIDEDGNIVTSAEIKASGIDFRSEKFCVDSTNFTLNEDGDVWFSGNITGSKISGSEIESSKSIGSLSMNTTLNGSVLTQTVIGNGFGISAKLENGELLIKDASKPDIETKLTSLGLTTNAISTYGITASIINGGTPITSENIGSQTIGYATNADTANRANTADEAFEAHHLSSYYTTDYVNINSYGNFVPSSSGTMRCGGSQGKWSEVWAENGTIQTSDRNLKHDIEDIDERYVDFITKLMPKRFRMNSGTSGRFHMGFVAQDVEKLLAECGIETTEFAGLIKDVYKDDDGNDVEYYALRYSEFIAPLVTAWQRTEDKLNNLISTLKDKGVI